MIREFSLEETAEYLGAEYDGDPISYSGVSTDSRTIKAGELYVALLGEEHDGHAYMDSAKAKGAAGFLVAKSKNVPGRNIIEVDDTREAYGLLGQMNRRLFEGKVVGITGSSGKTSTKNMLSAILSEAGLTWSTPNNFNNEIGVPRTLLAIGEQHQFAVVELGARKVGDIRYIGQLTEPDVAVLLNAGESHLGIFGSYDNIVKTKGEIYKTAREDGFCILNLDDPAEGYWRAENPNANFVTFSLSDGLADVSGRIRSATNSGSDVEISIADGLDLPLAGENFELHLPLPGKHNVSNALASIAVAICLGVTIEQIKSGLESLIPTSGRLSPSLTSSGINLIDDSYNANPSSVKAALQVLAMQESKTIAVLGTMAELGADAQKLHEEVARCALDLGINELLALGEFAYQMQSLFGENAKAFDEKDLLVKHLKKNIKPGDTVLIKGSRFMLMDEIVNALTDK